MLERLRQVDVEVDEEHDVQADERQVADKPEPEFQLALEGREPERVDRVPELQREQHAELRVSVVDPFQVVHDEQLLEESHKVEHLRWLVVRVEVHAQVFVERAVLYERHTLSVLLLAHHVVRALEVSEVEHSHYECENF